MKQKKIHNNNRTKATTIKTIIESKICEKNDKKRMQQKLDSTEYSTVPGTFATETNAADTHTHSVTA